MNLGIGFEQVLFPLFEDPTGYLGVSVGAKVGYLFQYSNAEWTYVAENGDTTEYEHGPRAPVGGPYAMFSVGIPLRAVATH